MPKDLPSGADIPETEEWFVPFHNDNEPDKVQDEQVWANREHVFRFNTLPITDALPYVKPALLEETEPTAAPTIPQGLRP